MRETAYFMTVRLIRITRKLRPVLMIMLITILFSGDLFSQIDLTSSASEVTKNVKTGIGVFQGLVGAYGGGRAGWLMATGRGESVMAIITWILAYAITTIAANLV